MTRLRFASSLVLAASLVYSALLFYTMIHGPFEELFLGRPAVWWLAILAALPTCFLFLTVSLRLFLLTMHIKATPLEDMLEKCRQEGVGGVKKRDERDRP